MSEHLVTVKVTTEGGREELSILVQEAFRDLRFQLTFPEPYAAALTQALGRPPGALHVEITFDPPVMMLPADVWRTIAEAPDVFVDRLRRELGEGDEADESDP